MLLLVRNKTSMQRNGTPPKNNNIIATSGCQNSWRKAAFQSTVTYGTFVK